MTYNIVEFGTGKYAIRRRNFIERLFNFGGEYRDFSATHYWSELNPLLRIEFTTTSIDKAKELLEIYKTIPKVIE